MTEWFEGILRGYLIGTDAPEEVLNALDMVLRPRQTGHLDQPIASPLTAAPDSP
ncbi:hypothetical protein [Zavarzinella formosa]|uniref:hypothetical protein n=1 Tax=Zavarzinella formosa TaxID=360055 RepID=UPI0002F9558E|nr:hypothetical protein [Zavarzinella formosa]